MSSIAIRAVGVGKQYRLGVGGPAYRTLRDTVADAFRASFLRSRRGELGPRQDIGGRQTFWALKDLACEVAQGEVVGIVGSNGAGKSTLLKVLSRVTEPTEGHVELRGRVGSLLEVGTGFHPELTGRENVFLSGAILGMTRAELSRKFDEIVAFSEIGEFLDTPVKRYSSGMYVRLAFAVAVHLDPEILLVDEVLAVGDAAFQSKCVTKMLEVSRGGRTVLFVSHNLGMVSALCERALLLRDGRLVEDGPTQDVIGRYLESRELAAGLSLSERTDRSGNGAFRFTDLSVLNAEGWPVESVMSGQSITIVLDYRAPAEEDLENVLFEIRLSTTLGVNLFACLTRACGGNFSRLPPQGRVRCEIPSLPLAPGGYRLRLLGKIRDVVADELTSAAELSVVAGDFFGSGRLTPPSCGPILVKHLWHAGDGYDARLVVATGSAGRRAAER